MNIIKLMDHSSFYSKNFFPDNDHQSSSLINDSIS